MHKRIKRLLLTLLVALLSPFEVYGYDGQLFDGMAQLDERPGFEKSISRVRDAGIYKIALFARSRKYLGENEEELLNLYKDNKDLIVLGAPKYFLHKNDIGKIIPQIRIAIGRLILESSNPPIN